MMDEGQHYNQSNTGNYSAYVQGSGNATVNVTIPTPTKQWLKPSRQIMSKAFVGRQTLVDTLIEDITTGKNVAITGKESIRAFQGMGGIGKTYLALKLAIDLYDFFPGGVIRIDVGPQVTNEASVQLPLSRLASYAFGGIVPQGSFHPEQVASWLQETASGPFLVIFDDLWYSTPLRLLSRALPPGTPLLITTRFTNIAQAIGATLVPLDRLTLEDGLALLINRLHCHDDQTHRDSLKKLVQLLGGHALALEIAVAQIKKLPRLATVLHELEQGIGQDKLQGLKLLHGDERDENLERSFALSYNYLTPEQQHLFRTLGAFAEETVITADAASAIWELGDINTAQIALFDLVDLGFLTEIEEATADISTFRMHSLLRIYARALAEKEHELDQACYRLAQFFADLSWQAVTSSPQNYEILDLHLPDLLAVLHWSEKNDLSLFARLLDALDRFLLIRGQTTLLETYLPTAIAASNTIGNKRRSANLLQSLGDLERRLGNIDQARVHYDAALPLYRAERDRLGEANLLRSLGDMFIAQNEWTNAKSYYEPAQALYVIERDPLGLANTLIDLGRARFELGDHVQGMADIQQAAQLFYKVQNPQWARIAEQRLMEMRSRIQEPGDG